MQHKESEHQITAKQTKQEQNKNKETKQKQRNKLNKESKREKSKRKKKINGLGDGYGLLLEHQIALMIHRQPIWKSHIQLSLEPLRHLGQTSRSNLQCCQCSLVSCCLGSHDQLFPPASSVRESKRMISSIVCSAFFESSHRTVLVGWP